MPSFQISELATNAGRVLVWLVLAGLVISAVYLIRLVISRWLERREPLVCLELTPPAHNTETIASTEDLYASLHGLLHSVGMKDRVTGYRHRVGLEIIATKADGIRFVVSLPELLARTVEQLIAGYLPTVRIIRVKAQSVPTKASIQRYKQRLHYAYPLQTGDRLDAQDPLNYITNAMTKLETAEEMRLQLLIRPVYKAEVSKLTHMIRRNEDLSSQLHGGNYLGKVTGLVRSALFAITDGVGMAYQSASSSPYAKSNYDARKLADKHAKPQRYLSSFEYELVSTIDTKLSKPLFEAELRAIVFTRSKAETKRRNRAVGAGLQLLSVAEHQRLKRQRTLSPLQRRMLYKQTVQRLMPLKPQLILSASEVAALYHFPTSTQATDNMASSLSRTLAAPISMKRSSNLDLRLGVNQHHGIETPIGLTAAERQRHIYVVGGTGNGKTTMLQYAIQQDIENGKGLTVIDPHGDLAESILRHMPAHRMQDVIYLNPDDLDRPIGINLLELTSGLTGNDLLREKDLITESVVSVMRKIFSEDDSGGHRIEYVLRNTVQTALTIEGSTLFTIFRLLNNKKFRQSVVRELEDEDLKNFWNNELGKAGDFQKVKMAAGITAKIGRFLFSASARLMLEQERSTIDFAEILDDKKILICNFSKGLLGEDTSSLFGTTVLAKLQIATLRRARIEQNVRTEHYLYIDEFQNFATMSFVQMLSEARKYKLYLTMAEQSTAQQDQQRLVDIILANVGTTVCFRTGSPADEFRLLPLFKPFITEGELANLPSYCFYARVAAIQAQEPMSGMTVLLPPVDNKTIRNEIVKLSRTTYGNDRLDSKPKTVPQKPKIIAANSPTNKPRPRPVNAAKSYETAHG